MFSALMKRLKDENAELISQVNDNFRDLLLAVPSGEERADEEFRPAPECIENIKTYLGDLPGKIDWQIYDHCAAVTRLYAAFERYVNEIVKSYVDMLPELYHSMADLPDKVAINHRIGVGQILQKIGSRKQYRNVDEATAIRSLSAGQPDGSEYKLIPEAFLVEKLNYRMDVIGAIFSALDFGQCVSKIESHLAVREFIENKVGESTTASSELERFVRFRNDAAHDVPEDLLSHDGVRELQLLIIALGTALSDIVRGKVIERHIELGHTRTIGTVTEIHYKGSVIILTLSEAASIATGDLICTSKNGVNRMAAVNALQDDNNDVQHLEGKVGQEVGLKLSIRPDIGSEVKTVVLPSKHTQLSLEVTQELPAEVEEVVQRDDEISPETTDTESGG